MGVQIEQAIPEADPHNTSQRAPRYLYQLLHISITQRHQRHSERLPDRVQCVFDHLEVGAEGCCYNGHR